LSRSGIVSLDRAEAVIEITEWVEVPKKILTLESNNTNQNSTSEAGAATSTPDSKDNLNSDSDANSSAPIDESNAQETITEKVLKKRTFRVPLKVSYSCSIV
jgi:hypoxia up-regulated 1